MRRRAVAVVATQGISPVMVMLVALVIALILLLASPVKAQETTAEETTVLAADAADRKVEAETDNVSVEVDNGEVSVSTDDGSSSKKGTSQQSSVTVQQNQSTDGTGSRASTGDVNIGASQTGTSCKNPKFVREFSDDRDLLTDSFNINGNHFRIKFTTSPSPVGTNPNNVSVRVDVLTGNQRSTGEGFTANRGSDGSDNIPEGPGTFRLDIEADNAEYDITVDDCRGNDNNNNNNNNNRRRHRHHDRDRNRHHDRDRHDNRFFGRGAANQQYTRVVEERVIKETIPNKGRLAATGGVPLTGAAFLALASVGLGVSILRSATRRDP